jgi:hypothetical protein
MKKIAVVLLALVVGACAYKHEPIYNVDDPVPPSAQALPADKIGKAITESAQVLRWTVENAGPGHLVATQSQPKMSATVDIYYTQTSWRIVYKTSTGLRAEDGHIHDHYNLWIRNLEQEIKVHLNNVGVN